MTSGSVPFKPGCYLLKVSGEQHSAIEIVDNSDRTRCCRLTLTDKRTEFFFKFDCPVDNAVVKYISSQSEAPPSDLKTPELEWTRIPKLLYLLKLIQFGWLPKRLQRFGLRGEKFVIAGARVKNLSEIAEQNVEFRYLRIYGLDDDSLFRDGLSRVKGEFISSELDEHVETVSPKKDPQACVYIHLHYWELWPEIESLIRRNCDGMDLVITTTEDRPLEVTRIRRIFPAAKILKVQNRGRDVGPFMELLSSGIFDSYLAVCKIHGKLSKKNGKKTIAGERIRNYAYLSLLEEGNALTAIRCFVENSDLGIIGPRKLLLPPVGVSARSFLKSEWPIMSRIYARLGMAHPPQNESFFAGTMFWFRPSALSRLRELKLTTSDFNAEKGEKRKTLQNALERVFCSIAASSGYKIACVSPTVQESIKEPVVEIMH